MKEISHLKDGRANMVDIGEKNPTERIAVARGRIRVGKDTLKKIEDFKITKGNVYETARLAGIMGAKETPHLIPLCHPIPLEKIEIIFWPEEEEDYGIINIESLVKTHWKTGVEMEALTAVSIAALTIYDMIKGVEKDAVIEEIKLIYKRGGKSGEIKLGESLILKKSENPELR